MKILLKNLFIYICLLLPISSRADSCETNYTTQQDCAQNDYHNGVCIWNGSACTERCPNTTGENPTCTNWNGCYINTSDAWGSQATCSPCGPGTYNNTSGATSCLSCEGDFSYSQGQTFDTTYANTYGLDTCPWVCTNGYFKGNNNSECLSCPDTTHPKTYGSQEINNIGTCTCPNSTDLIETTESNGDKYYCGTCGVGTSTINNNITTCTCPATSNRVHGIQEYRTNNVPVECACPSGANWDNNRCKCSANKYLHQDNNGVYSCESCPEHSTSAVGSTNVNDCQCDDDFPKRILDKNNKLIGCSACADNATFYNGSCQCKSGYYGDGASSCTQCPIGTTTTIGATQRSDCQMNHNTKFCYGSGDNKKCMHLIPAGTVISVSNDA